MNLVLPIWPKCVQGGRGQMVGKSAYVLNGSPLLPVFLISLGILNGIGVLK